MTPILNGWVLGAYTAMLGRLSAANAALKTTEVRNIPSDSDSESEHSSYTEQYVLSLLRLYCTLNSVQIYFACIFFSLKLHLKKTLVSTLPILKLVTNFHGGKSWILCK